MAIGAGGKMYVRRMEPTLVLRIHHVAFVAGGRFVPQAGRRVRHSSENTVDEQKRDNPDGESPFGGHGFLYILTLPIICLNFKPQFVI
jgi:hypothetical protein